MAQQPISEHHEHIFHNKIVRWIEYRLPIFGFLRQELVVYPTPKNLNYWWNFGSLAGIILVIMIATGLFLAMQYVPHVNHAFDSVERIMRDVNYGWLIRYLHMNGASMFFIVVYLHMFRGLYYGSYKKPRELLWILGVVILLMLMATAFMGYVLPWGQMSFWGATVITNLFSAIPIVGDEIVTWLWGGYAVSNPTLNRFFVLHYLFPFLIIGVVFLHLVALHRHGSNNPLGIDIKEPEKEKIPFHPYYTVKDLFGLGIFLIIYSGFVFFAPNFFGEPDNYIPANPLVTPAHIVPEWYFLPFYAILRSVPDKLGGVILMFSAVFVLFVLPWLDRSPIRSGRFRPWFKPFFWLLVIDCLILGWVGAKPAEDPYLTIGRIAALYYFLYFLAILPLLTVFEPHRHLPHSINESPRLPKIKTLVLIGGILLFSDHALAEAQEALPPPNQKWSHEGLTGTYNRAELQRGFQVYRKVCATCHSLNQISYRNLSDIGFTAEEVKALAAELEVLDINEEGQEMRRPGLPSDKFAHPYANEKAARYANGGALPPDLSVIVKARKKGEDYIYAILTGYQQPSNDIKIGEGMHYNPYFSGSQIAMPPPLSTDVVTYDDGTPATIEQMSRDVTAFLAWTAEPELEQRKRLGIKIIIYLTIMTTLLYFIMRRVWRQVAK